MRLTDADLLKGQMESVCMGIMAGTDSYDAPLKTIDNAPTVDAVPVVRCKNCKWWKTNYSWNGNEHKICVREAYEPLRNAEDFCSYGERRGDE